ncbi:inositol monophosphatase family protein [Trueperella sp. LYQ141]|uniref:inositol monophosphatase family protein n=1 Tax=Trueperella sp. LYQ141 TaxID=3391058 RepID=UPI003983ACA3
MIAACQLADIAEKAARGVRDMLLTAFDNPGKVEWKRNFHDPVTVHDRRAEHALRACLWEHAPDSLILGEEEGQLIGRDARPRTPTPDDIIWLLDPIDGTANFASGLDIWCVSIGAICGDEVIAGVIYQPTCDRLYRADNSGAYRNGVTITASQAPISDMLITTSFPSERLEDRVGAARGYDLLLTHAKSMRRIGSTALSLAYVAEGVCGGTFAMGTQPWDIGAGIALIQRAGGVFRGVDDARRIHHRRPFAYASYLAGGTPQVCDLMFEAMCCAAAQPLQTPYFAPEEDA